MVDDVISVNSHCSTFIAALSTADLLAPLFGSRTAGRAMLTLPYTRTQHTECAGFVR